MTQNEHLRVLVVGGGIGGLSAAVALRLQGHQVEVYEKSKSNSELGNAVYCAPNCTTALNHLGVYPEKIGGVVSRGVKFLGQNLELQDNKVFPDAYRATWQSEWYLLTRSALHTALKERATAPTSASLPGPPVKIRTGTPVSSIDPSKPSITLLADGTIVSNKADLVVVADGIYSTARADVLGAEVPLYSAGMCCYRLLIPTADLLADPETKVFADAPGMLLQVASADRRIVLYPCDDGKMMNLVAFVPRGEGGDIKKDLTGYDQTVHKPDLLAHFSSYHPSVLKMLDMAPADGVKQWELLDMALQPSLINRRAVLIGDAAHPFLPHMGQGAAQAIEDGCALGAVLDGTARAADVPKRLELWQRCRKERAHKIVEFTRHRAREADGSQGPPQTGEELGAAINYCIYHDAWKHAKIELEAYMAFEAKS